MCGNSRGSRSRACWPRVLSPLEDQAVGVRERHGLSAKTAEYSVVCSGACGTATGTVVVQVLPAPLPHYIFDRDPGPEWGREPELAIAIGTTQCGGDAGEDEWRSMSPRILRWRRPVDMSCDATIMLKGKEPQDGLAAPGRGAVA